MRELRCADAGMTCDGVITAENDDEVMRQAAGHVQQAHPDLELDDATQAQIRSLIHDA